MLAQSLSADRKSAAAAGRDGRSARGNEGSPASAAAAAPGVSSPIDPNESDRLATYTRYVCHVWIRIGMRALDSR